ncbi:hypothetical protein ACIA8E_18820 [Streptomyces sp. NPDC051664]|uniref:hypothetical protein n=1 Tax=Streptomyces sp. NPDC051664 TaxID=3365668 RepID=UPI003787522F
MNRPACALLAMLFLLAACDFPSSSPAKAEHSSKLGSGAHSPNPRQAEVEKVQAVLTPRINFLAETYGEGTGSPCSSATSKLFTKSCAEMVDAVRDLADGILESIDGKQGFGTLRRVSIAAQDSAASYKKLSCGTLPTSLDVQEECRKSGAVIAQSPADFHDGVNLGLAGL